jgi:hypothetical protein
MSPLYNSQVATNSPLGMVAPGDPASQLLFNNETPVAGQASIAFAIQPRTISGGLTELSFQLECPNGLGAGVFQLQDADVDAAANYDSINFGGATPGQISLANLNASGVGRVELQTAARFVRALCITAPGAAVTLRVRQQ